MRETRPQSEVVTVRLAEVADAAAVAEAHVRAWQAAYPGLMPQDYLDALDVPTRAAQWERQLRRAPANRDPRVAVVTVGSKVMGFAVFGRPRDAAEDDLGELYAFNLHPDVWGVGAGSVLLPWVHEQLAAMGYSRSVLWVVPGNVRARRFYEKHGWEDGGVQRTAEVLGVTVPEVCYRRAARPTATASTSDRPTGS